MEKTEKLFIKWWKRKFQIESNNVIYKVKKNEFWLYNVRVNIWDENSKEEPFLRPCLILNNYLNQSNSIKTAPQLSATFYKVHSNIITL